MKINQIKNVLVVCLIFVFGLAPVITSAQYVLRNSIIKDFYIQPNIGLSQYYGDLNEKRLYNQHPRFAFGAVLGYQINPIFGLRGQFLSTNLYSERTDQNIVFSSRVRDGALNLTININEVLAKSITNFYKRTSLKFYVFSGVGISSYASKLNDLKTGELISEHAEKQHEFSLPLGAGAVYKLSNNFSINLEYVDHTIFGGTKLDFTDKNKKNNDHYSYFSVGLQLRIGVKDTDNDSVIDKYDQCPGLYGKVALAGCPDSDNDGIANKDDVCPDVPGDIRNKGCPDTDRDGTIDRDDDCPYTAGKKELHGCPDKDNDGVADKDDKCPDVAGKKELAGCPDRDGDGVIDNLDACPDIKGLIEFNGCPDTDCDDIIDSQDACPDVAGKKELNGCPDKDNDGIADKDDKCPDQAGKKELAGCPDSDNDGIADKDDLCPEIKGLAAFAGCPDSDGDGIPDYKDDCPKVAGVAANNGCPLTVKNPLTTFQRKVTFNSGSSEVFPSFKNMMCLDEIVAIIKENPEAKISVAGFADNAEPNDMQLSEKRADYVIDYLKKKSNKPLKIEKSYFGKNKPVTINNTGEGRTLNRRVEIKITK